MVSLKRWFLQSDRPAARMRPSRWRNRREERRWNYLEAIESREMFAGTPTQLIFIGQPSQVAANSPMSPSIQVAIADFAGQIVNNDNVTQVRLFITTSPLNGTFSSTSTITVAASGGVANFTNVSFTLVGSYSITAGTIGGPLTLTSIPSNVFTVTPAATKLEFIQAPVDLTAGNLFTNSISVGIKDSAGNVVTTDRSNVTLSILSGPSNGTLIGTTTVQAVNGVATFAGITLPKSGSYRLQAKDSNTTITGVTSGTFTVSPGIATSLTFAQQPTNTPGSAVLSPHPVVYVLDPLGNVVTGDASTVTLSIVTGPSGGTIAGNVSAVAVDGVATFSNISFPVFGSYTLQAADGSLNVAISNAFAITGPPAKLVFQVQPSQSTVGHTMPSFTVLVQDASGNIVVNDSSPVMISIATGAGSLSGTTTVNAINGVATFTGLSLSATGNYTLVASDGVLTNATSNTFLVNGLASQLAFIQQPSASAAGAPIPNTVIVQVQDSSGNLVIDDSSLITMSLNGGTLTGLSTTVVNASNGVATFTNLIPSAAGTFTLGAASGSLTGANSASFVVAPSASKVVITQQPVSVAATSTMPPIIVEIRNDDNNVVTTNKSPVTLAIVSGPSNGSVTGTTTVNAVSGVATFSNLKFSVPGNYQLVAFSGILFTDTTDVFTVSGPPAKLVINQQPQSTVIAGQTMSTFTVSVRDASNNVVVTDHSTVTLTISTGPAGATIIGNATASVVNGVATFSNLAFNTAGTSYKLTASDPGLTSVVTNAFKVTPDVTTAHLKLVSSPTTSLVGVKLTSNIVISVIDQFNNIITTDSSTIKLTKISGAGNLSGTLSVKANKGVATFSNVILSQSDSYVLKATDDKFSSPSTVTNGTISFTAIITPAITTVAAPKVSSSYAQGKTVSISNTIKSLIKTPIGFTGNATIIDIDNPGTPLDTSPVSSNGSVKFDIPANLTAGTHTLRILYQGDANHTGGQSPTFDFVVQQASTTTVLTASATNLTTSSTLTLTVNVNTFAGATLARTGLIVIKDNGVPIPSGTLSLASSTAFISLSPLTAGTHKYSASYLGDDNYKLSNSSTLTIKVT